MQWFRFYNEAIDDRKLKRIARKSGQPLISILGAWSVLMALANNDHDRGHLLLSDQDPFTRADLVNEIGHGLDENVADQIISEFESLGMLKTDVDLDTYYLPAFSKRQYESDNSTKRVQRHRERQEREKEQPCNDDVTLQERSCNTPETETEQKHSRAETETEKKEEKASGKPPPPPTPSQAMFSAIGEAYRFDLKLLTSKQRGRLNTVGKRIRKAEYTVEEVLATGIHWWAEDWRGKKGSIPTDSQFFETLSQLRQGKEISVQEAESW